MPEIGWCAAGKAQSGTKGLEFKYSEQDCNSSNMNEINMNMNSVHVLTIKEAKSIKEKFSST